MLRFLVVALLPGLQALLPGALLPELQALLPGGAAAWATGAAACGAVHVNPERSFGGTNGEPPSEASQLRKGGSGVPPGKLKKPTLQMVQSTLFLSYICEYYLPIL